MDSTDVGNLGAAQEQRAILREWMQQQNLHDPNRPDFALTPRTRRLRISGTEGKDNPPVTPFVTVIAVPTPPWHDLWASSDTTVFTWLAAQERHYEPFASGRRFPGEPRPMHGGIIMAESDWGGSRHLRRYIAIERNGRVELGLGGGACLWHNELKGFLLTPVVGYVWHLLGFVSDLYSRFKQNRRFLLLLNMRETQGALLGGLANGWAEPWGEGGFRTSCNEVNVQICHDQIGPSLDGTAARNLATEIAYEIEAAWGMGGEKFYPRCFRRNRDNTQGEFDTAAIRE